MGVKGCVTALKAPAAAPFFPVVLGCRLSSANTFDRLHMKGCPKGMRPSVKYVTCERFELNAHTGKWKFPRGFREHEIICLDANEENPYGPPCEDFIADMSEKYFDETVDVSVSQEI